MSDRSSELVMTPSLSKKTPHLHRARIVPKRRDFTAPTAAEWPSSPAGATARSAAKRRPSLPVPPEPQSADDPKDADRVHAQSGQAGGPQDRAPVRHGRSEPAPP